MQTKAEVEEIEEQISSKLLKEDKRLIFSNEKFEEIIKESIQPLNCQNLLKKLNESRKPFSFPSNYVFASLAKRSYIEKREVQKDQCLHGKQVEGDWRLLTVAYNEDRALNGYVGAAYWNPDMYQVVVVHRGTHNVGGGFADLKGVLLNQHVLQIDSAITFTDKVISVLKKINEDTGSNLQLFQTGHSLGAWLAPIAAFYAKYLVKKGDYFVASDDFEKTGYHVSTVIFDGPGCRNMLDNIQVKLKNRYSSCLIDSLDITCYLSTPNLVNACNLQVGKVYRVFLNLSEKEKEKLQHMNILNFTQFTHSIAKIKEALDPNTGSIKVEKVLDWPLLISKDKKPVYWNEYFWGVEAVLKSIPMIGQAMKAMKAKELCHELRDFLKLGNASNNFDIEDESACLENGARSIRYKIQYLNEDPKNYHSLNVFTQLECQFLQVYKLIKELSLDNFEFQSMFPCLQGNLELAEKTVEMLKDYEVKNGFITSKNLQEIIPYVKHMLHLFPNMKQEVEEAWKSLPTYVMRTFFELTFSSYVKSIKNSVEFANDDLHMKDFFENSSYNLQIVESNIYLESVRMYNILKSSENCYKYENNHIFLSLSDIMYLTNSLFIEFLKKVVDKYLIVVGCNYMLNDKVEVFLEDIFEVLKEKSNIKVILITERDSELSEYVTMCNETNPSFSKIRNTNVRFNQLTLDSQRKLLEESTVIFQGKEFKFDRLINTNDSDNLNTLIDSETIVELFKKNRIEIGKALPSLEQVEHFYIDRKLVKTVKVKKEIFVAEDLRNDLLVISNIDKHSVSELIRGKSVCNFEDRNPNENVATGIIVLKGENDEKDFEKLCEEYPNYNLHWIKKKTNSEFIWQTSYGTLSGIRKHMESYERDLSENEYSENNGSINVVNVDDVGKFKEKFIIIAAEPGMGKSTALTYLGTQATDSKWLIRINLVERKNQLEEINFSEVDSIVNFLLEDNNNAPSCELTKRLLTYRLVKDGNIVLLLDGLDEVSKICQKSVVQLLKTLKGTEVEKVFISTRLHLREQLEDTLSTFAYIFKPFNNDDQKQFLKKFWQKGLDFHADQECLDNYIHYVLNFISKSIGDKERKFMGIPLQMRMIAEAFKEGLENYSNSIEDPIFPQTFDVLQLYDRFVDVKYQVYFRKIGIDVELSNVQKSLFTIGLNNIHMHLAIKALFPEMEEAFCGTHLLPEEEMQEMKLIGIIQFINDNIVFIHPTFAEYFIAKFLVHRLNRKDGNIQKYNITVQFLSKELFESKNEVIKSFIDYCLAKDKTHLAALKGNLSDLQDNTTFMITDALGRSAAHYACQEGHKEIVDVLIKEGAYFGADVLGKTPMHYASRYNKGTQVIRCLLENFKNCVNYTDKNGQVPLYYAADQNNWNIVDKFLAEEGKFDNYQADTLTSRHNTAEMLYKKGKYKEALQLYEKVLEKRNELGGNHPDVLITRQHIARILNNQGNHSEALTIFKEVFELQKTHLKDNHPDTLKTQHNIAFTLYRLDQLSEASRIIQEVLSKREEVLVHNHPDTLTTKHVAALILMEQGEFDECMHILKKNLEIQEELLGPDHSDTLATKHDIAVTLLLQGKLEEALSISQEVFKKRIEVLGIDHLYTAYTYSVIQKINATLNNAN